MKKIPTLFKRDPETHRVIPELQEGCAWVHEGQGLISIKVDGQNVRIHQGKLQRRLRPPSGGYDNASYVACHPEDPKDQYLFKAWKNYEEARGMARDGIYEALGPNIQGNPHQLKALTLVRVVPVAYELLLCGEPAVKLRLAIRRAETVEALYQVLKRTLEESPEIEGLVFLVEDACLMPTSHAKIKQRDYGLPWPRSRPEGGASSERPVGGPIL